MTRDAARLSVAPMMDWTDRHCRALHRLLSGRALLYTEMVTAPAVLHGDRDRLLGFGPQEHPVVLQLGGSDPGELAEAARIGADRGYDRIDLNCGCPSDRVQSGAFGAVLMKSPDLVAECAAAMIAAVRVPISVKCRIGVDDQAPEEALPRFLSAVRGAGVRDVTIHARKAWLQGLSPKENRDIPPLDYPLVHRMKRDFPDLHLTLNGGVATLEAAQAHLAAGMDGVMIGRAAYHDPANLLGPADRAIWGQGRETSAEEAVSGMLPHIEAHLSAGGRLNQVTRHMLGLFTGRPGARGWRRILSEEAGRDGAGPEVVERALASVTRLAA
ncbi:tRNA dihydrouridine(20/20a) synthase DusA [Wenxinia saemankumensis]|uniref:tRNA-dihydrouridine(20/20a) synthase n=1 Tax=Wenxinia saemankumensis TaxID=1447782 RepID=A0A1M6HER1_9RHOB|nr:tRNA dihydrouridine(20/20a) synthase DusA [Wenxinia saemankumensis]SHJ20691.1 tRNA-U16,U17-dihydrouridine synthase [Wenxinia saemankumensis]